MRNNLIPTVVSDKNGKITTVHKKQDSATSKASSVPAPSLPFNSGYRPSDETIETYDQVVGGRIYAVLREANKGREVGMNKTVFILNATNKQRELYADLLERRDGFGDIVAAATSSSMSDRDRPGENEMLSIALIYDKDMFNEFPNHPTAKKAAKQQLKLRAYRNTLSQLWKEPAITEVKSRKDAFRLGEMTPETVDEVRSYMKLREVVDTHCPQDDAPLGELLDIALHSGEHSFDEVVEVVKSHGTRDVNTVLGILNGASSAVAEGWL